MSDNVDVVFTPAARHEQEKRGSAKGYARKIAAGFPDRVTPELKGFIGSLDTAFLATTSAEGAPYIQHRGGPKGFIKVLDDKTLGFADFAGCSASAVLRMPRSMPPKTIACSGTTAYQ